jgi:7-cyano-7-deazaguanine synthase in queuosine biosynthesis
MSATGNVTDNLSGTTLTLEDGLNLYIDDKPFSRLGKIDSLDRDLLRVAGFIFAADLAIKRLEREQSLRSISIRIPVVNIQAFERVREQIEEALRTLSFDNWNISFIQLDTGTPSKAKHWPAKDDSTLMFSGGLDSYAGAADIVKRQKSLTLVSHVTHNRPVKTAQSNLASVIERTSKVRIDHLQVSVSGRKHKTLPFPSDNAREESQRTRSFLFTSLAAIAARLTGSRRVIVMAENGQFAIHLPLSEARVASFSTHTAHPKFLAEMESLLRQLFLCNDLEVKNPFVYSTKAEVVALLSKQQQTAIKQSTSCWRASRIPNGYTHCGECVPCLCRRIALERNDIQLIEYQRDLLSENVSKLPADDLGKRNLSDLCQFITFFAGPNRITANDELCISFPELYSEHLDPTKAIGMYRRFADEALAVFNKYPHVRKLLV